MAVGYAVNSDVCLAVSYSGRGLFNALNGELLSRDDTEPEDSWLMSIPFRARGIGVLSDAEINLAGIYGGGLATITSNRWSIEVVSVDWPDHIVFLQPPGINAVILENSMGCGRIDVTEEFRACGFSETGKSLVVATSNYLEFYAQLEP
jgi:hypothetical protein